MRAISFLLGAIVLMLCGANAHAQGCAAILTPHFSVYTSVTRDGTKIFTSVTMQGYASIGSSAGCNMSAAVHHVGAENVLNGVAHWTYSATRCPSCYFTATNNEQIVGNPGTNYPFSFVGDAICSMVGQFFTSQPPGGQLPGCIAPSYQSESTVVAQADATENTVTDFTQSISDTANDSFDGRLVTEYNATGGGTSYDNCWWSGNSAGLVDGNIVNGSTWTVAGGSVSGQHNKWGWDHIGYTPEAVAFYRANGAAHQHPVPCGFKVYQEMRIHCSSGAIVSYTPPLGNLLSSYIEATPMQVTNCRQDTVNTACQTLPH